MVHDLVTTLSFLVAVLLFGVALIYALRARLSSAVGVTLVPVLLANLVWAAVLAWDARSGWLGVPGHYFLEMLRYGGWLTLLWMALPREAEDPWLNALPRLMVAVWIMLLLAGTVVSTALDVELILVWPPALFSLAGLVCTVLVLVAAEQVGRNRSPAAYWAIKQVLIGIGLIAAFDAVLFSISYVFSDVPMYLWQGRGLANAVACLPLIIGIRRLRSAQDTQRVGRAAGFFTVVVLLTGVYLLLLAIFGIYVDRFGGSWGGALTIAFLVAGIGALAIVAFSAEARALLQVFIQKHFLAQKYDYREEWLRFVRILDGDGPARDRGELGGRVLNALGAITGSPHGGLWISAEDHGYVPVAGRFCAGEAPVFPNDLTHEHWMEVLSQHNWILDLDGQYPPGLNRYGVPQWLRELPNVWLVVPLSVAGRVEGFAVLSLPLAKDRSLTWEDLDLLRTAATQAAGSLALQRALDDIGQLQQFEAFNRLGAFLMHDLKNVLAQQQLVVKNFPRFRDQPEFIDDVILTVENATQRMERLIEQLTSGTTTPHRKRFLVSAVCREALQVVADRQPKPSCSDIPPVSISADPERLRSALVHLLRNAQDATALDGRIMLQASFNNGLLTLVVEDTGHGMSEEFIRDRLFRPFDSTKGTSGMGVGAYQAREYLREMGGDISVHSRSQHGTRFTLSIPALDTDVIGELAVAAP